MSANALQMKRQTGLLKPFSFDVLVENVEHLIDLAFSVIL